MHLRYEEKPETSAVIRSIYVNQATTPIPWSDIRPNMLCVVGQGESTGSYLIKEITPEGVKMSEIYFKRGVIDITKDRLNMIHPLAFLEIPTVKQTKAVTIGDIYQIATTGLVVKVIPGKRWLSIVDQLPIVLPMIPKVIIRAATQPTTEGNEE